MSPADADVVESAAAAIVHARRHTEGSTGRSFSAGHRCADDYLMQRVGTYSGRAIRRYGRLARLAMQRAESGE